jgi:hypothetical protein
VTIGWIILIAIAMAIVATRKNFRVISQPGDDVVMVFFANFATWVVLTVVAYFIGIGLNHTAAFITSVVKHV